MARFAGTIVGQTGPANFNGASTQYVVSTPAGVLYVVYVDSQSDVVFRKSSDGGVSWSDSTVVFAGTTTAVSVWYDRWSGISAGLIHIAYQESATDDTLYRTVNTESSDALSTQTVIFAGASTAAGCHMSITRARGGNVYCKTVIDAGTEGGFYRLANANVPNGAWDAARTNNEMATLDFEILVPGFAADNQDIMSIYWDVSANEISRYVYDDSGNSWAETSISTGMAEGVATTSWPHFDAAVDLTNSQIVLVAWNGVDTANADLLGWTVTESAITAFTTPVVLNSTDDQGMVAITIDESDADRWIVYYCGTAAGTETFPTAVHVYCKGTTDAGATWGPETKLSGGNTHSIVMLLSAPRRPRGRIGVVYHDNLALDELVSISPNVQAHASSMLGM